MTVSCVPRLLESGRPFLNVCRAMYSSLVRSERERASESVRERECVCEREIERERERETQIERARAARENLTRV